MCLLSLSNTTNPAKKSGWKKAVCVEKVLQFRENGKKQPICSDFFLLLVAKANFVVVCYLWHG